MSRKQVILSEHAAQAARILGGQIRLARHARRITASRLAKIIDVSPRTMTLIERGDPSVSMGNVFNAAIAAGVPLFDINDPKTLARMDNEVSQMLTLVPSNVRNRKEPGVDTNF